MTFREKLEKEYPDMNIGVIIANNCPCDYAYERETPCCPIDIGQDCSDCWNREIPEVDDATMEAVVKDLKNGVTNIPEEVIDKFNSVGNPYPITSEDTRKILDSGNRRQFASGAVRDIQEGKGDMASIPWESILRLSVHYENGAKKYDRWNFRKGIPVSSFIDSACRHLAKYQCGLDDEDHLAAAAFNILGAMLMENTKPEMQDLPLREGKCTFEYFEKTV